MMYHSLEYQGEGCHKPSFIEFPLNHVMRAGKKVLNNALSLKGDEGIRNWVSLIPHTTDSTELELGMLTELLLFPRNHLKIAIFHHF